jgi:AcrR family transcriptional regulator
MRQTLRPSVPNIPRRLVKAATGNVDLIEARREALINAGLMVFIEKGFHGATVRDIGRAARMTQGTIYNYVRSKDDILYLVCDRVVTEYQSETREALKDSADPAARIASAVTAVCRVMYRRRDEVKLIYQESHALEARSLRVIKARVETFIATFETILRDAARELGVPIRHPHFAANILTFLPMMIVLRRWSFGRELDEEAVVAELSQFVVRGLGFDAPVRP